MSEPSGPSISPELFLQMILGAGPEGLPQLGLSGDEVREIRQQLGMPPMPGVGGEGAATPAAAPSPGAPAFATPLHEEPTDQQKEGPSAIERTEHAQRIEAPLEPRADERFQEVLQSLWTVAASAVDVQGDAAALRLDDNPFLRLVVEETEPEEFYPGDWEAEAEIEVEGLTGSLPEISLQFMHRLQALLPDRAAVREFFAGAGAATFDRMERDGVGTPETRIDLVMMPLRPLRPRRCTESVRRFTSALRRYLVRQDEADRKTGFYITWAHLGDFLSFTRGKECMTQGIFFHHEVLGRYWHLVQDRSYRLDKEEANSLRVLANSVAILLDELARLMGRNDTDPSLLAVRQRLKQISAATTPRADRHPAAEAERAGELVRRLLDGRSEVTPLWPTLVDDMMASPTAWLPNSSFQHLTTIEVASGLSRTAFAARRTDAASSFFNAGVSLLRHRRTAEEDERERLERARVGLNLLGLVWALEAADGEPVPALTEHDGMSCAVNLFAAATAISDWTDHNRALLREIAGALFALAPQLGGPTQVSFYQIGNSLRELGIETEAGDPTKLGDSLEFLLNQLTRGIWMPYQRVEQKQWMSVDTARWLLQVAFPGEWLHLSDRFVTLLQAVAELTETPEQVVREAYDGLAPRGPVDPGRGPLVAGGLLDEREWNAVAQGATAGEDRSLGSILRDKDLLEWFVQEG